MNESDKKALAVIDMMPPEIREQARKRAMDLMRYFQNLDMGMDEAAIAMTYLLISMERMTFDWPDAVKKDLVYS